MRTRRRATIEDLRQAIDCLPRHTRIAMLEGIAANDIIVGAYSTADGICPMLAAHRHGGRTSQIGFAQAWDRVAFRGERSARARRASERELLILRSHLEASLLEDDVAAGALAAARRDHDALMARRRADAIAVPIPDAIPGSRRPGEPDRTPELRHRPGWAWTRLVRRYDEYERIMCRLEGARADEQAGEPALASPGAGSAV
jgi:hypothetical protein